MTKPEIEVKIPEIEKLIKECQVDIKDLVNYTHDLRTNIHEFERNRNKFLEEIQEYSNSIRESLQFGRLTQKTGTEEELESCQQTTRCMLDYHSDAVRNKINCDLDIHECNSMVTESNTEIKNFRGLISEYEGDISKIIREICITI